jgi:hypothetical protein
MDDVEPADMRPAPRHTDAHPAAVTSDSARQGPSGRRVLWVLLLGLSAAAVIGVALYYIYMPR